jgi:hypothetical protein
MYIQQRITPQVVTSDYNWFNDVLLETPQLIEPVDGDVLCPHNASSGGNSNIILKWDAVAGATNYIVQWCLNTSFQGPTLQSKIVTATEYNLQTITEVRKYEEVYWRVFAIDGQGGISEKSETRSFKYECPVGQNKGDGSGNNSPPQGESRNSGQCKDFDVDLKLTGPATSGCCTKVAYYLKINFNCKDMFGRTILTFLGTGWTLEKNPTVATSSIISSTDTKAVVNIDSTEHQDLTIRANANFRNNITGVTFSCEVSKDISVSCDDSDSRLSICYVKPGATWYVHPDLHGISVAPTDIMKRPGSVTSSVVLYPRQLGGEPDVIDEGVPVGEIPIGHAIAMGPATRTEKDEYDEPTCEGSDSDPSPCWGASKASLGKITGEMLEAQTHIALGCGLKLSSGPNRLSVNNEHLVGKTPYRRGLKKYGACSIEVFYGSGLTIVNERLVVNAGCGLLLNQGAINFYPQQVAGNGLKVGPSPGCSIEVDPGCGLEISSGKVAVKQSDLVGNGLIAGTNCKLDVNPGCGISLVAGKVSVNPTDLAGNGLKVGVGEGACKIDVNTGCGLTIEEGVVKTSGATGSYEVCTDIICGPGYECPIATFHTFNFSCGVFTGVS